MLTFEQFNESKKIKDIPKNVQNFVSNWLIGQYSLAILSKDVIKWFKDNDCIIDKPTLVYRDVSSERYDKQKNQSWTKNKSIAISFAKDEPSSPPSKFLKNKIGFLYSVIIEPKDCIVDFNKFIKKCPIDLQYHLGIDDYENEGEILTRFIDKNIVNAKKIKY